MADFATRAQVALDAGFRSRVGIAITLVALQATSERQASPTWTRKRIDLAFTVLRDPQSAIVRFALALAALDLPLTATDAELAAKTHELWDGIAGVSPEDR